MKRMIFVMQLLLIGISAQCQSILAKTTAMSDRLDICSQKTTSIIFPAAIKSVDRGSNDILAQMPNGVDNVLKVKAAKANFSETNLTVITSDGAFYTFNVNYNPTPASLVIQTKSGTVASGVTMPTQFSNRNENAQTLDALVKSAYMAHRNIHRIKDATYEVNVSLSGLYTANDLFFYKLLLDNTSAIDYDIYAIRFTVSDKKRVKRTASQQITLTPIKITGEDKPVLAHSKRAIIVALPRQTITKEKHLAIEIVEKNGGRNLICTIGNKTLLKASPIHE